MSWRDLPSLISHLSTLASELRELNGLLRESIAQQTGRPARTPPATPSRTREFPHSRPRTAADTLVMTPEAYRQQEIEAATAARRGPGDPDAAPPARS